MKVLYLLMALSFVIGLLFGSIMSAVAKLAAGFLLPVVIAGLIAHWYRCTRSPSH